MGSTTSFHIVCRASRKLSKDVEPPEAPCLKRPEVEKDAASALSASAPPYKPPEGTPSLDELFPALSALAFGGTSLRRKLSFQNASCFCETTLVSMMRTRYLPHV